MLKVNLKNNMHVIIIKGLKNFSILKIQPPKVERNNLCEEIADQIHRTTQY